MAIDAVAGSGKTTTVLHIGSMEYTQNKKILLLTYNAKLKQDTRLRVKSLGLDKRIETHSFHSFGVKYYNSECKSDSGITAVIENVDAWTKPTKPIKPIPEYDIIVLDEVQDLTSLLFRFFLKILSDLSLTHRKATPATSPPQIVLMGDARQSIYQFRQSDERGEHL